MKRLLFGVTFAMALAAACGDGNEPIQTATAPTPTPDPRATFVLFGVVSEVTASGNIPLGGVVLDVASCGPTARRGCAFDKRVTTDAQGA